VWLSQNGGPEGRREGSSPYPPLEVRSLRKKKACERCGDEFEYEYKLGREAPSICDPCYQMQMDRDEDWPGNVDIDRL
jgi:hypothetical protein